MATRPSTTQTADSVSRRFKPEVLAGTTKPGRTIARTSQKLHYTQGEKSSSRNDAVSKKEIDMVRLWICCFFTCFRSDHSHTRCSPSTRWILLTRGFEVPTGGPIHHCQNSAFRAKTCTDPLTFRQKVTNESPLERARRRSPLGCPSRSDKWSNWFAIEPPRRSEEGYFRNLSTRAVSDTNA